MALLFCCSCRRYLVFSVLRFISPGVPHMLQLFKFPFVIVPHELEGSLGYVTAAAAVSSSSSQIVSLDVGGGSFQVDALSAPPRTCRATLPKYTIPFFNEQM